MSIRLHVSIRSVISMTLRATLVAMVALHVPGALAEDPLSRDATVTATGSVFCYDGETRHLTPLVGARIELMDSDCRGSQLCDDEMGRGHVDDMGNFRVTGRGGDILGGRPDVYIRVALNDDNGVRMTDEIGTTRSFSTPEHDHDNVSDGSVIDFGRTNRGEWSGPGESHWCAVWSALRTVYQEYLTESGQVAPPAGYLDIQYWSAIWAGTPWTNTDTVHWPIDFGSNTAKHEFGHSIRHAADGNGSHFTNDVTRFRYARNHDNGCADDDNAQPGELLASVIGYNFNEGWADYWEGEVGGCPGSMTDRVEYQVAMQLHAWQQFHSLTRMDMVRILSANPGAIHTGDEFGARLSSALGVTASPLTSEQRAAAIARAAAAVPRPPRRAYTEVQRSQIVQKRLREVQMETRRLRAALAVRDSLPSRPCRGDECAETFNRIVGPIFARAQLAVLDETRVALEQAASPRWPAEVQRHIAAGTFDRWAESYRATRQGNVRRIMAQAISEAEAVLARQRRLLGAGYAEMAQELAQARSRLAEGTGKRRNPRAELRLPQVELRSDGPRD